MSSTHIYFYSLMFILNVSVKFQSLVVCKFNICDDWSFKCFMPKKAASEQRNRCVALARKNARILQTLQQ